VGTELFGAGGRKDGHTEGTNGRIDMRKLMVTFSNFVNATKRKKQLNKRKGIYRY